MDALLATLRPRSVPGLTATPERRDGLHPLVFQQCVPIRHRIAADATRPLDLLVRFAWYVAVPDACDDAPIQTVRNVLAEDAARTALVVDAPAEAWRAGRKFLWIACPVGAPAGARAVHLAACRRGRGDAHPRIDHRQQLVELVCPAGHAESIRSQSRLSHRTRCLECFRTGSTGSALLGTRGRNGVNRFA